MLVPRHIQQLRPYMAGKTIEEVVNEFHPERISKLASNENRLGASPLGVRAAMNSFDQINNYPDPLSLKLRRKLAGLAGIRTENVIAGSGSEGVMSLIMRAFFLDDEEALTASATFIGFTVLAHSRGIRLREVPLTEDYRFDLPAIAASITSKTKLIYLANPNNPTGTCFSRSEFLNFMEKVPDHVLVIMDEAYYDFACDWEEYPDSMAYRFDNVITLRTFSKSHGLAGLRIGYGFAHDGLIRNLMKVKLPFEPSTPAQSAGYAAIDDTGFLQKTREMVLTGRERLYGFLDRQGISYVRSLANSVMIIFDTEKEAEEFAMEMLKLGVILRRLPAFGLPSCIRITVGRTDEMEHFEEGCRKIAMAGS